MGCGFALDMPNVWRCGGAHVELFPFLRPAQKALQQHMQGGVTRDSTMPKDFDFPGASGKVAWSISGAETCDPPLGTQN